MPGFRYSTTGRTDKEIEIDRYVQREFETTNTMTDATAAACFPDRHTILFMRNIIYLKDTSTTYHPKSNSQRELKPFIYTKLSPRPFCCHQLPYFSITSMQ